MKRDEAIDAAIARLSEIKDELRSLQAEELELRDRVKAWIADQGLDYDTKAKYITPSGHSISLYTQTRPSVDLEYLKTIVTKRQFTRAVAFNVSRCFRVS